MKSIALVSSLFVMSSNLLADEAAPAATKTADSSSKEFMSVIPEGATLPANVAKIRILNGMDIGSTKVYNNDGKNDNQYNIKKSVMTSTLILDYGILDNLTVEMGIPFALKSKASSDVPASLSGVSDSHKTGLSDIELGALYNFLNTGDLLVSAGLGMRLPTGSQTSLDNGQVKFGTSGESYDLGLRLNVDFQPIAGLWLSAQDQEEMAVRTVKNKEFDTYLDKKGITRKSFVQAAYSLGAASQSLKAFSVKTRYAYQRTAEARDRSNGQVVDAAATTHKVGAGAGFDGRAYGVPVALDALYMTPVAGKNAKVNSSVDLTLSTYVQI